MDENIYDNYKNYINKIFSGNFNATQRYINELLIVERRLLENILQGQ